MKEAIFGNLGTKAMALFLALLMWAYLYTASTAEKDMETTFQPVVTVPADVVSCTSALHVPSRELAPAARRTSVGA